MLDGPREGRRSFGLGFDPGAEASHARERATARFLARNAEKPLL
jgi:hypothetical protein